MYTKKLIFLFQFEQKQEFKQLIFKFNFIQIKQNFMFYLGVRNKSKSSKVEQHLMLQMFLFI